MASTTAPSEASRQAPAAPEVLPYGPAVTRLLPGMRGASLRVNRYLAVPLLRAGLGPIFSNPLTGSLMVLRTRGRRSGRWRSAPLGYVIRDGAVYCCAGFGRATDWLRNLEADPRVELILPGRTVSGFAQIVGDLAEQAPAMRDLLGSMSVISRPMLGDLRRASDTEIRSLLDALPLVRIRVTGLAAGPWDPGGSGWLLTTGLCAIGVARWVYGRFRPSARRC